MKKGKKGERQLNNKQNGKFPCVRRGTFTFKLAFEKTPLSVDQKQ